jgi:hypothetical protein
MKRFGKLDSEMKDFKKYPKYEEELRNAYNEAFKVQYTLMSGETKKLEMALFRHDF